MKIFRRLFKRISVSRGQGGFTLLEGLVAIGILGGGLLVMILAMAGGMLAVGENAEGVTAQEIARSQMEYIKSLAYDSDGSSYTAISVPDDYSVALAVASVPSTNANIQKVTAAISRNGTVVMTVTDYKVNR
jgi:type II secretory pathway pseudopilin PulG